ncbi:MAG TPA: hypothetical protein VFA07_07465 [Chthonomonadaceae bacterium]|nr:hypothetical protein [Chthonomonadaceae bacterium]
MTLAEARSYVGKRCSIRWRDHAGQEQITRSVVHDVLYVPLYGGYLITDDGDISLEWIGQVSVQGDVPVSAETRNPAACGMQAA